MGKGSRQRPTNVPMAQTDANFESIFGKRVPTYMKKLIPEETEMQVRLKEDASELGKCGCGRSPTGKCIGWHGLNEEQLAEAKRKWDLENYSKQAQELWNDSCTSGRKERI